METKHTEDETNELLCPEHGTHWHIEFNLSVLGKHTKAADILRSLQELCSVRYETAFYQPFTIHLKVINGSSTLTKNSTEWKTLKECLELETLNGNVKKTHEFRETVDKTTAVCSVYQITANGNTFASLHPEFPIFVRKNMNGQRVHIARDGRYIEAMPYSEFMGKEAHNNDNGKIIFIQFISGENQELPVPCTTKVKMQEECPIFKKMTAIIKKRIISMPPAPVSAPALVSTPAPVAKITAPVTKVSQLPQKTAVVKKPAPVAQAPVIQAQPPVAQVQPPVAQVHPPVVKAQPPVVKAQTQAHPRSLVSFLLPADAPVAQAPVAQAQVAQAQVAQAQVQKPSKIESYDQIVLNKLYDKYGHALLTTMLNEFRDCNKE